jgi:hypothetical protein
MRDVARLREIEEAGEGGVPRNRQVAAAERDRRARARPAGRLVGSALLRADDTRRNRGLGPEDLGADPAWAAPRAVRK